MFTLTLVTPEKRLVTGQEIEEIFVPAFCGELNILPGHAPLMTTLSTGILRYRLKGNSSLQAVAISWGYCQVNPFGVNVLAETAERPEDIDLDRVKRAEESAEKMLSSGDVGYDDLEKYHRKLTRASARKSVATRGDGSAE
jgi:F-type H+-transporting ATPase subunit epsilon